MKRQVVFVIISTFCHAHVTDVLAADLPSQFIAPVISAPPDAVNWTGVFVGAHAGGAWDQTGGYSTFPCPCTSANGSLAGATGGLQVGYNYQIGPVVIGMEGEFDRASLRGSYPALDGIDEVTSSVDYFATIAAKLGAAIGPTLIYAKGGAAWTHSIHGDFDAVEAESFSTQYVKQGIAVGGGIEYALTHYWSVKLEYQHIDPGTKPATFIGTLGDSFTANMYQRIDLITIGVNWRL
jgi:outer membrane immunogenic protein